jgi:hypothetical protein
VRLYQGITNTRPLHPLPTPLTNPDQVARPLNYCGVEALRFCMSLILLMACHQAEC